MTAHDYRLTGSRREILHRAGCPRLAVARRSPAGYPFGDGKTPAQLRAALAEAGGTRETVRFCRVCLPDLERLPAWRVPVCWAPGCGKPMDDLAHVRDHCFVGEDHGRLLGYEPPEGTP